MKGTAPSPVSPGSRKHRPPQPKEDLAVDVDDIRTWPQEKVRGGISIYYQIALGAPPPEEWDGEDGTVAKIRRAFKMNINQRKRIKNVIAKTHHAMLFGEDYDAARAPRAGTRSIADGSIEQQHVADCRERGLSFSETTLYINNDAFKNGHPTVTDWYFYHDALSQMTAKCTVKSMKETIIPGTTRSI